jgi:adenylate cyclase class IV
MSRLTMTEIEFKYKADNISLSAFDQFCKDKSPVKHITASGWDHFYSSDKDSGAFYRHRTGPDINQLTYKRKKNDTNNVVRDEQNLNMSDSETTGSVRAFLLRFKYEFNASLFKTCFVYVYDRYTLVYYLVYDTDMKELGRFIEIEMSEEHSWASEDEAYKELVIIEKICKSVGISPQARVRKSLFELFAKEK